jgi:hypothetical protein
LEKMPKVTSCTSSQGIELGSVSGTVHSGTLAAAALPPSSSLCAIGAAAKGVLKAKPVGWREMNPVLLKNRREGLSLSSWLPRSSRGARRDPEEPTEL